MEVPRMRTYTSKDASPSRVSPLGKRRESANSLDDNEKFTNHCNNALAKIRLIYLRLLARDRLETSHEVVRRRNFKVSSIHKSGRPAQFTKRTVTRIVSFSN
ncbi:hypothetical protein SEPCBS119000_005515 [Sporothrix epigloea]|uniref:Uncharacterized protein n=1 Tax=Sporothrix epigloea TaxID=1892477 RepID=A0ABP0E245_9PEZI